MYIKCFVIWVQPFIWGRHLFKIQFISCKQWYGKSIERALNEHWIYPLQTDKDCYQWKQISNACLGWPTVYSSWCPDYILLSFECTDITTLLQSRTIFSLVFNCSNLIITVLHFVFWLHCLNKCCIIIWHLFKGSIY